MFDMYPAANTQSRGSGYPYATPLAYSSPSVMMPASTYGGYHSAFPTAHGMYGHPVHMDPYPPMMHRGVRPTSAFASIYQRSHDEDPLVQAVEEARRILIENPNPTVMRFRLESGRKKALLVGINYYGQPRELKGCVNDAEKMQNFIEKHGYAKENMTILVDDPKWKTDLPTRQNILKALSDLVNDTRQGDNLFFGFSGHGGSQKDENGDEKDDGMDETICPVDYKKAGVIVDDELFDVLVKPLSRGVRLTAVMDCCHSGTVLDLPYEFVATPENMQQASHSGPGGARTRAHASPQMMSSQRFARLQSKVERKIAKSSTPRPGSTGFAGDDPLHVLGDVIMFSGCMDKQTSADAMTDKFQLPTTAGPGGRGGACTNALIKACMDRPQLTFIDLLEDMRVTLQQLGFSQVPQLSSSRPLNLNTTFTL